MSKVKAAHGTLDDIYCVSEKKKVRLNVSGYVPAGKRGGIRIVGKCVNGHPVTSFIGKDKFDKAISSGKLIIGGSETSGGACPYADAAPSATGGAEDFGTDGSMYDGGAKRRSRGSRKGSRKSRGSRKGSRKSRGSRKGSRKSRGSRKGSRKSRGSRGAH